MRNDRKRYLFIVVVLLLVLAGIFTPAQTYAASKRATLSAKSKKVAIDKTFTLQLKNVKQLVSWEVRDQNILSISGLQGSKNQKVRLRAVGTGTTTVIARTNGDDQTYLCSVSVYDPVKITGAGTVTNGRSKYLKIKGTKQSPDWASLNPSVVSIRKSSRYKAKITAVGEGTAYVTANIAGRTYYHKITVKPNTGKPKIAVAYCNTVEDTFARNALRRLGAKVSIVKRVTNVENYDGLVIPGGVDINPARYHQRNVASRNINNYVDKLQLQLVDQFVKAGKPVFGICRGEQLLNVYFGGTLKQHINGHSNGVYHSTKATAGSIVQSACGSSFRVYSSHHQAVKKLGTGLRATQKASDGTIEAIEHETLPVFAVQWHPELMGKGAGDAIIKKFISICKTYMNEG